MVTTRRALLGGFAAVPVVSAMPALARGRLDLPEAEAALDAAFAESAPPALAGGIVTRDGLLWSGVRGVRRVASDDPAALNDRWHLGSNTKAMTAAVFGRLVEQGRARWAMPLDAAFPALTIDPAWATTTLDDLMHHRAGLLDAGLLDRAWLVAAHADQRPLPVQRADLAARAFAAPPAGPKGEFSYGNGNYIIVGAAIEAITGQAWETVMAAEMFGPLGLTSAGFGAPRGASPWGHSGGVAIDPAGFSDNPRALGPAGTVHMDMTDYARFVTTMMDGGPGWLTEETRRRLLTPPAGGPPAYACGWGVGNDPKGGGPLITHNGSNTFWYATVLAAPERGVGVISLSNDAGAGQRACGGLIRRLAAIEVAA